MRRYCASCGKLMQKSLRPLNQYDEKTGKREVDVIFTCPNYRWYKLGHWKLIITTVYERFE